ncbi:MAG: alpha-ketoglutarate-dependent dioxygenase AlkB, partial [Pseudomonadota bacterium]
IPCFGDTIASLSLASAAMMVFTGPSGETGYLHLRPCSLLVLTEDARSKWRHAIPARKSDMMDGERKPRSRRVSLTFRKIRIS